MSAAPTQSPAHHILFVEDVATQLRRSPNAVRWLINSKQLKAAKLGGRVCVRQSDLDAFVEDAFTAAV